MGDYNQEEKPVNANLKREYETRVGDDLPTIEQAYKNIQPTVHDTDNPKGARSKTSYLRGKNFGLEDYHGDDHGGTSSDDSFVSTKTDGKGDGNITPSNRRTRNKYEYTTQRDGQAYRRTGEDDAGRDTSAQFARMMGDNLIALRKIHESPPKWNGPRIKVYSGKARENLDDFEDDIRSSCDSLGIWSNRERIRYMKRFLDGRQQISSQHCLRQGGIHLTRFLRRCRKDSKITDLKLISFICSP